MMLLGLYLRNPKVRQTVSSSDEDEKESNEPDHGEDTDQLEEKQEEESGEIAARITNKVF